MRDHNARSESRARSWRESCESCGRPVVISPERAEAGKFISCDCGGGWVVACRHCSRQGYFSEWPGVEPGPYMRGGFPGPMAGPVRAMEGGAR